MFCLRYRAFFSVFQILIDPSAVDTHHARRILRAFHPSLDLERCDPCIDQLSDALICTHVLHTQHIWLFSSICTSLQLVRQPARLCTPTAVSAPASDHTAEQTLTRIAVTHRTVNECLHLQAGLRDNAADLIKRQFPGRYDTRQTLSF